MAQHGAIDHARCSSRGQQIILEFFTSYAADLDDMGDWAGDHFLFLSSADVIALLISASLLSTHPTAGMAEVREAMSIKCQSRCSRDLFLQLLRLQCQHAWTKHSTSRAPPAVHGRLVTPSAPSDQ